MFINHINTTQPFYLRKTKCARKNQTNPLMNYREKPCEIVLSCYIISVRDVNNCVPLYPNYQSPPKKNKKKTKKTTLCVTPLRE